MTYPCLVSGLPPSGTRSVVFRLPPARLSVPAPVAAGLQDCHKVLRERGSQTRLTKSAVGFTRLWLIEPNRSITCKEVRQ